MQIADSVVETRNDFDPDVERYFQEQIESLFDAILSKGEPINNVVPNNIAFVHRYADCKRLLRFLVALGADVNLQDNRGMTPLMYAAISRQEESWLAVDYLLCQGADLMAKDNNGSTALSHLLSSNNVTVSKLKILLRHGMDVETVKFHTTDPRIRDISRVCSTLSILCIPRCIARFSRGMWLPEDVIRGAQQFLTE